MRKLSASRQRQPAPGDRRGGHTRNARGQPRRWARAGVYVEQKYFARAALHPVKSADLDTIVSLHAWRWFLFRLCVLNLQMPPIAKRSRPPLARMLKIHDLLKAEKYPNCATVAKLLEISTKTAQRDFEYMRDQLNRPIEYDQLQRGYYYTEKVSGFPTVQVSEGEVLALLVAGKALEQYQGTPYEKQLTAAFEKLTGALDQTISFTPEAGLTAVSFGSTGQSKIDLATYDALSKAVLGHLEIDFDYRKPGSKKPEQRHVQPYHLTYRDNLCYVIGQDVAKKALRQFALPRMANVTLRKETFAVPADFSAEKYFKGAFGAQGGTGNYQVRIRFDAQAAFYIKERRWHPTQKIKELRGDAIELSFLLSDLEEVQRWILSWGVHAKVIEPRDLVKNVHTIAKQVSERYSIPQTRRST